MKTILVGRKQRTALNSNGRHNPSLTDIRPFVGVVNTADPGANFGNAALAEPPYALGFHVTDNPQGVLDTLRRRKRLDQGRGEQDFYPGFYVSAIPHVWRNRAKNRWAFMDRLTHDELNRLIAALASKVREQNETGYITRHELYRANNMILAPADDRTMSPHILIELANQPYNIDFAKPHFLRDLGITPVAEASVVEVRFRGRFAEVSSKPTIEMWRLLRRNRLVDGLFHRGGLMAAGLPQLVIWNTRSILDFGPARV